MSESNISLDFGYIYLREHRSYSVYDCYKVGKTLSIPDRENNYITGEIVRGRFIKVFYIENKLTTIDKGIKAYFCHHNVKYDGGTEFFKKQIVNEIESFLDLTTVKYRVLSDFEIEELTRVKRNRNPTRFVEAVKRVIKSLKKEQTSNISVGGGGDTIFSIRPYQEDIVANTVVFLKEKRKGVLVLPCGVGKTLISLWTTLRMGCERILIGVPNTLLLQQWCDKAMVVFRDRPVFINESKNNDKCVVIATYQSITKISGSFDMVIQDEVHHLTSMRSENSQDKKSWTRILNIPTLYRLSLTATLKNIENRSLSEGDNFIKIVSNDNTEIFGDVIERRSLLWAIEKDIVCDYSIQTIHTTSKEIEEKIAISSDKNGDDNIEEKDLNYRLLLSAYTALKSIYDGDSHHILVYTNSQKNSDKVVYYINRLLTENYFCFDSFFLSSYHSNLFSKKQKDIIERFASSKRSVLSCVYCLGEGWDLPLLDGVLFAENMTSNIRIVQSALRASRKNKNEPLKHTKIILPILDSEWLVDRKSQDYKKIREVIYQMGLEDTTIMQKIRVYRLNIHDNKNKKTERKESGVNEYDPSITRDLRLRTDTRSSFGVSYDKAKKIISEKKISNKEEYYKLCEKDVRLQVEPDLFYRETFKGWIDYLSIPKIYYDLESCKKKIEEYIRVNPNLKNYYHDTAYICNKLCELDSRFPSSELWIDYYNIRQIKELIVISKPKRV